jgi:outer membrane protein OmpA-like peptidoglycan-associated protein
MAETGVRLDRVEDQLDRLDERLVKVDTDARAHDERLQRVEGRVAHLDAGLTDTRRQLRGMLAQAPSTGVRSSAAEPRTARSTPEAPPRRSLAGVIHVRFAFGSAELDTGARAALAAIAQELRDDPKLTLDLEGATDPVGSLEYNVRLSQLRVEAVRRWLEANGISRARILGAVGRGPLMDASVKDDAKRRVMVKLMTLE